MTGQAWGLTFVWDFWCYLFLWRHMNNCLIVENLIFSFWDGVCVIKICVFRFCFRMCRFCQAWLLDFVSFLLSNTKPCPYVTQCILQGLQCLKTVQISWNQKRMNCLRPLLEHTICACAAASTSMWAAQIWLAKQHLIYCLKIGTLSYGAST